MHRQQATIAAIAIFVSISIGLGQQSADTVLYNGKVLTVDSDFSTAQAVAIRDQEIAAVGTDDAILKLAGANTLKIDLKGKTVIPGMINTHIHLESPRDYVSELGALKSREFHLRVRGLNKDEILQQIRDVIAAFQIPEGEWLYFIPNWTASQAPIIFGQLNANELDKAAPKNPIIVKTATTIENQSLANGVALKEIFRKYGDFVETYGRTWIDEYGKPNGHLEPPASRLPWEDPEFVEGGLRPKPEDVAPYFRKILMEDYVSLGITTLSGGLNTSSIAAYKVLDSRGEMPLRYAYGAQAGFHPGEDMAQYQLGAGSEDLFVAALSSRAKDGGGVRMCVSMARDDKAVLEAAGQGLSSDMNLVAAQWWPRGQCNLDIEYSGGGGAGARGAALKGNYFRDWYRDLARNGLRSSNSHVSGDRSVTLALDEWEAIDRVSPGSVRGWTFDHCNLVKADDIPRAAKLGVMFSCKPSNAVASDRSRGARSPLVAYGADVLHNYASPVKSMLEAGINVSVEEEGQPWWGGIEILVTRKDRNGQVWGPHERVDRKTALTMATQNGANYILKGDQLGSIETGKLADLNILDRDYMTVPAEDISEIRPLLTMKGGQIVFLRTDFSEQEGLKPAGAVISTHEELLARRP